MIKAIITDIEGTTSSISFVKDTLFPYAYEKMADFIKVNIENKIVKNIIIQVAEEAHINPNNIELIISTLRQWINEDRKIAPLKDLQGLIWENGYSNGDFTAHIYEDAYEKLLYWHQKNIPLYVYSSGSVYAQKLFFAHTNYGNILHFFRDFFDTKIGNKKESQSYQKIIEKIAIPAPSIIFLSDIEAELNSAQEIGMKTILVDRENQIKNSHHHPIVKSFTEIDLKISNSDIV
ncbi:MAG: acireductone synthase [Cyanobacterium sp. T60_A2020_053]|nr:acireductone synthase [Cyanobacterium sp. T60_A2020_053]